MSPISSYNQANVFYRLMLLILLSSHCMLESAVVSTPLNSIAEHYYNPVQKLNSIKNWVWGRLHSTVQGNQNQTLCEFDFWTESIEKIEPNQTQSFRLCSSKFSNQTQWNIMGLVTVFNAILTGRQSGQKLQCLYGNPMANNI